MAVTCSPIPGCIRLLYEVMLQAISDDSVDTLNVGKCTAIVRLHTSYVVGTVTVGR